MDRDKMREIQDMRLRSGRMTRDYNDHLSGMDSGIYLLFRCFLAAAFFMAAVTFPMIQGDEIPNELKKIPDAVSVNYTIENTQDFLNNIIIK